MTTYPKHVAEMQKRVTEQISLLKKQKLIRDSELLTKKKGKKYVKKSS